LGCLQDGMLLLADAGLYSWQLWQRARERGAHLCWRIGASVELPLVRALDDGSYLALLYAPGLHAPTRHRLLQSARAGHPLDDDRAQLVRVVEYTVPDRNPDGELIVLATDLLDPAHLPAGELAWAYHQRWEHETALAEMKSQLLGSAAVLRSKSPELVEQEIYGLLLTHYAVRSFMTRAADQAELDPDRLSFLRAVRITRRQVTDQAAFPP
uniref:transposase n=1 Tax=Streptomyces blattellae TaxID=2569855 RepID=UPI002E2403BD